MLRDILMKHTPVQEAKEAKTSFHVILRCFLGEKAWWENRGEVRFILNEKTFQCGFFIKKKKKKAAGDC